MLRMLLLGLSLVGCAKTVPPTLAPDRVITAETADGWSLDVRHYPGPGPVAFLVHGMGANHYNFDYREEVSLAWWLQQRGWDVWVPELRGDPGSRAPSKRDLRDITFDDYARYDVPAALDAVLAETGAEQVYWVGHSMGGMLLYTTLAQRPEAVAAGVAISSPADFDTLLKLHKSLRGTGFLMRGRGRIPAAGLAKATVGLGRANPLYGRLANRDNLDFPVANGMAKVALTPLPRPVAFQATTWLKSSDLLATDGSKWLPDRGPDVPILVLGGAVDKIVPAANVAAACDVFPECEYRLMGVEGGFSTDYGHVDPVVGRTAAAEIYPVVEAFLAEHAASAVAERPADE